MSAEWKLKASASHSYSVIRSDRILNPDNAILAQVASLTPGSRRFVVIDRSVNRFYGERLRHYFDTRNVDTRVYVMTSGESRKDIRSVLSIIDSIERFGIRRYSDPIIAVGGGVITDTVGLTAQLYRRGTPYIRIPTTLVGIIDAGIGVKVGINFKNQKNLLGSFYGAESTIIDHSFLGTLPLRHIRNGMSEIIKIAVACDDYLFRLIENDVRVLMRQKLQTGTGDEVIARAISAMLAQLRPNPWEHDLRRSVDFGHTFSPRLEMDSNGAILHGESVAIDMAICCGIALRRGLLDASTASRIIAVLMSAGLPLFHRLCTMPTLLAALDDSVRRRDGQQHVFLPTAIGHGTFVEDIRCDDVMEAVGWVRDCIVLDRCDEELQGSRAFWAELAPRAAEVE